MFVRSACGHASALSWGRCGRHTERQSGVSITPLAASLPPTVFILALKSERGWELWKVGVWGGVATALSHRAGPGAVCSRDACPVGPGMRPGRHTLSSVRPLGHG